MRWTLLLVTSVALYGQLGGVLDRARRKIEDADRKAKPVTTRVEKAVDAYTPWTDAQEQEIGETTAAKMVAIFGLADTPKLTRYVNLVGSTVARNATRPLPYRFAVLDSDIVGAFALPGGYIFVTLGALQTMDNESQLAGVLGHEIIHASERHLESEIRGKKGSAWAIEEAKAQAGSQTPEFLRRRAEALLQDLFNTKLSREKEDSADDQGTVLASKSGYQARGLQEFLRELEQMQNRPGGAKVTGQLLSTHPPFAERIAALDSVVRRTGSGGQTLAERYRDALK